MRGICQTSNEVSSGTTGGLGMGQRHLGCSSEQSDGGIVVAPRKRRASIVSEFDHRHGEGEVMGSNLVEIGE